MLVAFTTYRDKQPLCHRAMVLLIEFDVAIQLILERLKAPSRVHVQLLDHLPEELR